MTKHTHIQKTVSKLNSITYNQYVKLSVKRLTQNINKINIKVSQVNYKLA